MSYDLMMLTAIIVGVTTICSILILAVRLDRWVTGAVERHVSAALDAPDGQFDSHVEEALDVASSALPRPRGALDNAVSYQP